MFEIVMNAYWKCVDLREIPLGYFLSWTQFFLLCDKTRIEKASGAIPDTYVVHYCDFICATGKEQIFLFMFY